ncbi:ECF-type sigma factor [Nocardia brasiliensis]|uniref:ECF-type sigma factor n=1 Tax=Nocardia brasiliensis TaxID=37326 RepID=UPI00366EFB56
MPDHGDQHDVVRRETGSRRMAGYSNQEVADELGVTVSSMKNRYDLAKAKARDSVIRAGLRNRF